MPLARGTERGLSGQPLAAAVVLGLAVACSSPPARFRAPAESFLRLVEIEEDVAAGADARNHEQLLAEFLASEDADLRLWAARAVARIQPVGAVRMLAAQLEEETDPAVRQELIWALGRVGGDDALGTLRRVAGGESSAERGAAAESLAAIGAPAAGDVAKLLGDPSLSVRREAVLALARHPQLPVGDELIAAIEREHGSRDATLRWAAMKALEQRPALAARHARLLAKNVGEGNFLATIFALRALSRLEDAHGVDETVAALEDPRQFWLARVAAQRALEAWSARASLPAAVRERAAAALVRGPRPAPPSVPLATVRERGADGTEDGASAVERVESNDSRRALRRRQPLPKIVLRVAGRGEIVLELFARRAPRSTAWLRKVIESMEKEELRPLAVDPLGGLLLPLPAGVPAPPEETHRGPIRRGTLIVEWGAEPAPRLRLAGLPLPELEGRVLVLGRAILGLRLLDRIDADDRLAFRKLRVE